MSNQPILTVTLNPALDVTTSVDRLIPQRKLRCSAQRYDAGGGGVNVSRAIQILGGSSRIVVALGGATGEQYKQVLAATGIETEVWPARGETRFSLTVMEQSTGEHYRLLLPGPTQEQQDVEALLAAFTTTLEQGYRFVVASGSLPPGVPVDTYAQLARLTRNAGAAFIIDASGPALAASFEERPYLVRVNHHEAQELMGGSNPEDSAMRLTDHLVSTGQAEVAVVTAGDRGALVATADKRLQIRPPAVTVLSPVGAGDSFVGALTLGLARGWSLEDACRLAVAAATSTVTTPATALCEREATERYLAQIAVTEAVSG